MSWWQQLSARGRALIVGLSLTSVLVVLGATVSVPYVAIGPGTTINTLGSYQNEPIFTFSGTDIPASVDEPAGSGSHLNMTTVSVTDGMTLFGALGLWVTGEYALVPREEQFPPNKTVEQVQQENAKQFSDSQSLSEIAALRYLNAHDPASLGRYPEVTYVGDIPADSPSAEVLDPQDQILALNDQPVTTVESLRTALATTLPGEVATVTVRRTGADGSTTDEDVKVTLAARPEIGPSGFLGIVAAQRPYAPFRIDNSLAKSEIGGPSAGMMFALGLIDRLTPGDLTGGHFIAGTGTVDADGNVGAIGGIVLKEITVSDAGAEYLLVPADNCAEALTRVPDGLKLVKVSTLTDAVAAVGDIAAGRPTVGC